MSRTFSPVPRPVPFDRPVLWTEGRLAGIPERRLASPAPDPLVPSVRVPLRFRTLVSPEEEAWAVASALARNITGAQVVRTTAAMRHGFRLPRPRARQGLIHLNRPPEFARIRRRGTVCTQYSYPEEDLVEIEGCVVTSPLRTLVDLAPLMSRDEFVVAADSLVACRAEGYFPSPRGTLTPEELRDFAANRSRIAGLPRFRAWIESVRVGSDSARETLLRLRCEDHGLQGLTPGHAEYDDATGAILFQADLALVPQRISIQFESEQFHGEHRQVVRDIERARRTEQAGWREIRISGADLRSRTRFHGQPMPVAVALVLAAAERCGSLREVWDPCAVPDASNGRRRRPGS